MSAATTLVRTLFSLPGSSAADTGGLLKQAASAHENLLHDACDQNPEPARSLAPIGVFLGGRASAARKQRLLCHPLFLEGLHGLAACSPKLLRWHESVTAPAAPRPDTVSDPAAPASLGNVTLVCHLRGECRRGPRREWRGEEEHRLCADILGRVEFPFCDWSLALRDGEGDWLGRQRIKLRLDRARACWELENAAELPFFVLSREDCLRLILANADPRGFRRLEFPNPRVKPRLQCTCSLGHGPMRYDPIGFQDTEAHAGRTGALVKRLIEAIRLNSPVVYRELRACMHTIRGFEFPESAQGVVGSFSDPTLPGVMGINVPYTAHHEPCLDPFCFTWFGHELAHTKNYLSDNILYNRGQALLRNPADRTPTVPRYGRALAVRTLFQVPYVHLYEWTLLMDFWQAGFRGLPWQVAENVIAAGEEFAAEVVEAFGLIEAEAELTPLGEIALRHFRRLFTGLLARWHSLRPRGKSSA
jgi:hypothetical protein